MIIKISNIPIQVNTNIKLARCDLFHTNEPPLYIIDCGISVQLIHQRYEKEKLVYELFFDGTNKYTYTIYSKDEKRYDDIEYVASLDLISYILMKNKHYTFHASSFVFEDRAILLAGKSGVGKTTLAHRFAIEKTFEWINDDKPVLHWKNDALYVLSSPWMGKDQLGKQIEALAQSIYFIEQGNENKIIELKSIEKIICLREHLVWSFAQADVEAILLFIESIIKDVNIYKMVCTHTDAAYVTLKQHIQHSAKK